MAKQPAIITTTSQVNTQYSDKSTMLDSPLIRGFKAMAGNRRSVLRQLLAPLSLILLGSTLALWYFTLEDYAAPEPEVEPEVIWEPMPPATLAARLWPEHLFSRDDVSGRDPSTLPRYIHQSWMDETLPAKMSRWSQTCRAKNQHWQWILWTDADNLKMVEKYFPWFLETYKALPAEINRADACRNMYMYMFGGVYADLDTECIRPFDDLFQLHNVQFREQTSHVPMSTSDLAIAQVALFGRMGFDGTDETLEHTIPNAWMAASPGHPVFLLVLHKLKQAVEDLKWFNLGTSAEGLTGPVALYHAVEEYNEMVENGTSFDTFFKENPSYHLFERPSAEARLVVLPPATIYPYAWNNAGMQFRGVCWAGGRDFSSKKCKDGVVTKDTYAITYWSHSWSSDLSKNRDENTMKQISKAEKEEDE